MNNLYKRIVTMGMISFTAILAWIYCILEYRGKIAYVASISVILIISIYALLYSLAGLRTARDTELKSYINATVKDAVSNISNDYNAEDIERLSKASYVQLRKSASTLAQMAETTTEYYRYSVDSYNTMFKSMQELVSASTNKALKVMVKYNRDDNEKLLASMHTLAENLNRLGEELREITSEISVSGTKPQPDTMTEPEPKSDIIPFPVQSTSDNNGSNDDDKPAIPDNPNRQLSSEEIAALFAGSQETSVSDDIPDSSDSISDDKPAIPDDSNRQLSPEEIAALFASMQ